MIILYSLLSGLLYRLGGIGKPFNTKIRDFGIPTLAILYLSKYHLSWWIGMATFVLAFGMLVTYWDKWGTDDVEWYEWALTGFGYGISFITYPIAMGHWRGFIIRTLLLTLFMPLWKRYQPKIKIFHDKADLDEIGVGFVYFITLPLI